MSKISILLTSLLLMSFQCTKDDQDPILEQDYLFAVIYTNYAWGENIHGWYIDNSGLVCGFSNQKDPNFQWNIPEEGGFITETELNMNFIQADTSYFRIELPELFYYYELIEPASKGTLTERESGGADMGQLSFYCFDYDNDNNLYRFVTLKSQGDWTIKNTSQASDKIYDWLAGVQNRVGSKL